jgi:predicted nucleotidyltransferase
MKENEPMTFDDVLSELAAQRVRFVVTGGRAVVFHGVERPIADLDIVAGDAPDEASAAIRCLESMGFRVSVPLPAQLLVVQRMFDAKRREVDVNIRYLIPFATLLDRAAHFPLGGHDVAVIARDDLIAIKQQRGRDYDLDDVASLLR